MPVYKDKKRGSWYATIYYKDTVTNKERQLRKRGFATKKEALRWMDEQTTASTKSTFREMLELYLKDSGAKEYLCNRKRTYLDNYFGKYIDMPIDDIKKSDLIEWRNSLITSDLSVFLRNSGIEYVKSVFAFANAIYDVPNNATVLKRFKVKNEDRHEMETWTVNEFNQFISAIDNKVYHAYFSFLYWTGCRRGEALALTKDDIVGNKVKITKSIRNFSNGFMPLKTDTSKRTITIDDNLKDELKPLIQRANPFVFGGETPLSVSTLQRVFDKGIKDSGVKTIRIHDLRHSHATFLINNGANIVAVSKRLGHASINQTLSTYTHLLEKTNDELMEIISNANTD